MGNLIKCPMCEKDISPNAIACPHCGEPMKIEINTDSMDFCNVVLINSGYNKIKVIKCLRDYTGCGLKECKDCIDNTPSIMFNNITYSEAESIKSSFEMVGAEIELAPLNKVFSSFITKKDLIIEKSLKIKIKCPMCNSSNVVKINRGNFILRSIFRISSSSNSIQKNECKQCGYKW